MIFVAGIVKKSVDFSERNTLPISPAFFVYFFPPDAIMQNMKTILLLTILFSVTVSASSADSPPRISHQPVKAAIKGQPVYIRASIKDDTGPVKEANLFCSSSSDSAPFKVTMRASGVGSFIGTVPDAMVQNASEISYYIEAKDSLEQSSETPWYTIHFKTNPGSTAAKTAAKSSQKPKSAWKKPLLIAGGTAVAIGAGIAIADSGSSGGSSTASSDGLFSGTATKYFQFGANAATSEVYSFNINVLNDDRVATDDLHPGVHMEGNILANSFNLTAPVNSDDMSGQVYYSGTVVGDKITGSISGSVVSTSGTNGTYSGIFSANKQ